MNSRVFIGAVLLAASTALFAQTPGAQDSKGGPKEGRHEKRSCAQAPDPAKCEARRKEQSERMSQAREACKGTEGPDRGPCMSKQMCAKAPDPAKCEARGKERMQHRHEMQEKKSAAQAKPKT